MFGSKGKGVTEMGQMENREEQNMREYGVDEDDIQQRREFDEQSFNTERRILQWQVTLSSCMLTP